MARGDVLLCLQGFYCPSPAGEKDVVAMISSFEKPGWCAIVRGLQTTTIPIGATVPSSLEFACPMGHICKNGTGTPMPCCYEDQPEGILLTGARLSCSRYQPNAMSSQCVLCPPGVQCLQPFEGAGYSSTAAPCPESHYCEEGKLPMPCSSGYYGKGVGLIAQQDCSECPPGKYCTGGKIMGNCLPGYICSLRSSCASPGSSEVCKDETLAVSGGITVWNGFCPEGSYCPEGTPIPLRCPAGTRIKKDDVSYPAKHICDCIHCSSGQMCVTGSIFPKFCPKGFYCPGQESSSENPLKNCTPASQCGIYSLPVPCPAGTYQPLEQQEESTSCIACGEDLQTGDFTHQGYHCPSPNSTYQEICPAGHFCLPKRGPAVPCPAGYYRALVGGYNFSSCDLCGGGKYCPNATVVPINCPAGTYCSVGSPSPRICEGGFYCPANSTFIIPCPPGTYCMGGNEVPTICQPGTFCPAKSMLPTLCPIGTHANPNMTINRTNIEVACAPCPRGTFGADPVRLSCESCWAGYTCYGNTTRGDPQNVTVDRGEICPAGTFCGNGSYTPSKCARGTFNPEAGKSSIESCAQCPRNSFNNVTGQAACVPCGGSAVSTDDSLACECKGADRVFHPFDSACRCTAGFTIYNGVGESMPDEAVSDGILDCEPIVLNRCGAGELRSQSGNCLETCDDALCSSPPCYCQDGVDFCAASCPSFQTSKAEKVQIDDIIGTAVVCSCACSADSTNPKCADPNQTPIEKTYDLGSDSAGSTVLTITDSTSAKTYLVPGMASGPSASAQAQFIGSSPDGFSGVLDAPDSLFDDLGMLTCTMDSEGVCIEDADSASRRNALRRGHMYVNHSWSGTLKAGPSAYHHRRLFMAEGSGYISSRRNSRLRASDLDDSQVVGVQSPVVCIKGGGGIMWSITSANGIDHYPEYVSISLFNTNPSFDFGAFVGLGDSVKKGYAVTSFYYAFEQPGVYTFRDAGDKTKETVIGVVDPVVDCPRAFETNPIQPLSADLLKSFPTSTEDQNQMITPNYQLIIGICVGLSVVLIVILVTLYLRKTQGWGQSSAARPKYRKQGEFEDFHQMASKKEQVRRGAQSGVEDSVGGLSLDDVDDLGAGYVDLEGFNVQMLFDKLQDQTHLMAEQLTQQKHDVREFYDKVARETVTLRTLVDKHNQSGFSAEMVKRAERRQRDIDRELMRRKELGASALPKFERCLEWIEGDAKLRVEESVLFDQAWNSINGAEINDEDLLDDDKLSGLQECIATVRENIEGRRAQRSKVKFGDGAILLDRSRKPIERSILFDQKSNLKPSKGLLGVDPLTGIMVPILGTEMKYNGRHTVSVPSHCCMHPISGEIVPMEGNVYLDVIEGNLFVMNPSISDDVLCAGPIPYIVNHMSQKENCFPSSETLYAHLVPEEEKGWPLNQERDMIDPHSGLRVPVLAVTHDLRTNRIVAVGGAMLDPETRLMKPIQIGDIMEDPESRDVLVIMGVKIDEVSGCVMPIGAKNVDQETGEHITLVFGAPMHDEFSGAQCQVRRCISDPLNPSRTLAVDDDMCLILQELEDAYLTDVLKAFEQQIIVLQTQGSIVRSQPSLGDSSPGPKSRDLLQKMAPIVKLSRGKHDELQRVRLALNKVTLDQFVFVRDQHHRMYDLAETGGQKGALVDPITERELPILVGCLMFDEATKSDVQILDLEIDQETGLFEPLGCTIVDPLSGRLVSATICGPMKDPFSSNLVPITGLRRDPGTYHVYAESNLRSKPTASSGANLDSKLLADLLQQLSTSTSGSGALANLLGNLGHIENGKISQPAGTYSKKRPSVSLALDLYGVDVMTPERDDISTKANSDNFESALTKHVQKLNNLADQYRDEDDEDGTAEGLTGLVNQGEQEYRDMEHSLEEAHQQVMQVHVEAAREILAKDDIDDEAKARLIDGMAEKENQMTDLIDQEQARQIKHFEKVQLETANRRMRKLKQKQTRTRTLEELIDSGDATSTDEAAHQLSADMDEKMDARLNDLNLEYARKTSDAIAQEQARLLKALNQAGDLLPEDIDEMFDQYEKEVERIESKLRNELYDKTTAIEKQNDDSKSRKINVLRSTSSKHKSKKMWTAAKKRLGSLTLLKGASSSRNLETPKSPAELQALAKERHEKEAVRLAKALEEHAQAERATQQLRVDLAQSKETAALEQDFLKCLEATTDEEERNRLLQHHTLMMKELAKHQQSERTRQMAQLDKKLAAKKERRKREQAQMVEKEMALLKNPRRANDAAKIGAEAERHVRHDVENARMEKALFQQDSADVIAAQAQQKARADAERTQQESNFMDELSHVDDPTERARLIKENELKKAEMLAKLAIAKGKADEDLQKRLAERREKKLAMLAEQAAKESVLLLAESMRADSTVSTPLSAEDSMVIAKERHADLAARLEKALDDEASADRTELEQGIGMDHRKAAAVLEQELLTKLDCTADEATRKRILDAHKSQMEELRKQQAADKERQQQHLEKKLGERKQKRLLTEHAEIVAREMALQADPRKHAEALKVAVQVELQVQQAMEAARLKLEQQQQAILETASLSSQQQLVMDSQTLFQEDGLKSRLAAAGNDKNERDRLIQEHEFTMAKFAALNSVQKGKADENLQKKLEERRNKKRKVLEQQQATQDELMARVQADGKTAGKELDLLRKDGMLLVRQEEDAAQVAQDLVSDAQAQSKVLNDELQEKVVAAKESQHQRLSEKLSQGDLSADERKAMIEKHELEVRAMELQLQMDAAKQQLSLEQQLAARRAKKMRKMEHDNTKEREHAAQAATSSGASSQPTASTEEQAIKVEEQFAQKQQEELQELRTNMEKEKAKMLEEEKVKLEAKLNATSTESLSDDERQKIIEQHESNMKKLEGFMDKEKMRQESDLTAQLEERKRKKQERLKSHAQRKELEENLEKEKADELAKFEEEQEVLKRQEEEKFKMELEQENQRELTRIQQEMEAKVELKQNEELAKAQQRVEQASGDETEKV